MNKGFSVIELMFVIGILVLLITGLLVIYIHCLALNEHNLKFSIAMNLARQLMEEIYYNRNDWDSIVSSSYTQADINTNYHIEGYSAAVIVTPIDDQNNPSLKEVKIVICWRGRGARIIGEDRNLNGVWEREEEQYIPGYVRHQLDSPCEITTAIVKR